MREIFLEAESFAQKGGWVIDQQAMETLHSSYLMAHGMGVPVADATTEFVAEDGEYSVWALTRDWTAVWDVKDSAGKFQIAVNGKILPTVLGTNGAEWSWQFAGKVFLSAGTNRIALHDLTGFNGRCDAIYLTQSVEAPSNEQKAIDEMRKQLNWHRIEEFPQTFDLVVVGGGIAGICTALAAVRSGVSTCLINDRPILGGCNSSEIRVCQGGMIHLPPYERLGDLVKEIAPVQGFPSLYEAEFYEDYRKMAAFQVYDYRRYGSYQILLNERVTEIESDESGVHAVVCTNVETGKKQRIQAKWFSDCSGDGIVARLAGAEVMYGREAESEYGESLAPTEHQNLVMGHSIRWYSEEMQEDSPFPELDWNLKLTDESCLNVFCGDWEQETGFTRNMVSEIEYIRDYGLRAIYSNWSFQKHHFAEREKFRRSRLKWVSALGGKRESYRVKGDIVLTQQDLEEHRFHEDGTACITWSIDMHFPEPTNAAQFGEAFRSYAYHRGIVEPYPVPYRCLYSKDVPNLFLGGRLVSTSHVAFSAVRVQRTLGELGEVVGLAANICRLHNCTPREVYTQYLDELIEAMKKGAECPDAFACGIGSEEAYHFKDIGWIHFNPYNHPEQATLEKFKRGIAYMGLKHKYPLPDELK